MIALLSAALAYDCDLYPVDTCSGGGVASVSTSGTAVVATVEMGSFYKRMDVFARVCSPTGYSLHVADSPTNYGAGYDTGTSDHDAEMYLSGADLYANSTGSGRGAPIFAMYDWPGVLESARTDTSGCHTVRMTFADAASTRWASAMEFAPDATGEAGITARWRADLMHGPRLTYSTCVNAASSERGSACESEDTTLADMTRWYVALNRMVGDATLTGTGVEAACVVTSSDRRTTPASCL